MTRTDVTATRSASSPVVGYYVAILVTLTDWDTGQPTGTTTVYKAHLADGTPAGQPLNWGTGIAPATNSYDTETAARAGVRRAYRHLSGA